MAKEIWGRKRVCVECQASFYDMRRNPIACPKCGKTHQPVALLKSGGRPPARGKRLPETVTQEAVITAEKAPTEEESEELDDDDSPESVEDEADDEETETINEERDR